MAFWTDATDPKRKFNFVIDISTGPNQTAMKSFYAKTATKPSFTINAAEHNYLNHTFYYPGRLTWNDVSITFVDPGMKGGLGALDSASLALADILKAMGYNPPSSPTDDSTISKSKSVAALGNSVTITQLDDQGEELDKWTLVNPWLMETNFGDLDYSSDDLVEISCTFKYDFAKYKEADTEFFAPGQA